MFDLEYRYSFGFYAIFLKRKLCTQFRYILALQLGNVNYFHFIHCIALTFIEEKEKQREGSVMRYSKLTDGLGKNRILGSGRSLTVCPDYIGRGSQTGAHGVTDTKIFLSRVMGQRVYLSLGFFKSRGIMTLE